MLLGIWKNIEELESVLCLDELLVILEAAHKKEERERKFFAALKGITLDEGPSAQDKVEEMKRRIAGRQSGRSEEEIDLEEFGIDIEVEE